jgi:hypothetical protein
MEHSKPFRKSMTFEEAKQEIIENGYRERDIRRMKVHLSEPWSREMIDELNASTEQRRLKLKALLADAADEVTKASRQRQLDQCRILPDDAGVGIFPVYEDGLDKPAEFTDNAKIIRYRLDQGTLDSSKNEFWVPCAYNGVKGWDEYYCIPHWIESADEQKAFCGRHYGEQAWPDENGEVAEDPIRFINGELSLLRSAHQFKGSSDVSEKFRQESVCNMHRHSKQAFEYLSKSVALSLKRNDPRHRQVSQDKMRNSRPIPDDVDPDALRIIELAFRAGREAATASLHYRGIPVEAKQGKPLTDSQSKAGPKKEWTKAAREFLSENSSANSAKVAQHLKQIGVIYWDPEGSYRKAHTICFYDDETPDKSREQFQKAISKLKKS